VAQLSLAGGFSRRGILAILPDGDRGEDNVEDDEAGDGDGRCNQADRVGVDRGRDNDRGDVKLKVADSKGGCMVAVANELIVSCVLRLDAARVVPRARRLVEEDALDRVWRRKKKFITGRREKLPLRALATSNVIVIEPSGLRLATTASSPESAL